jgi:hypothetical protein
MSEKILELTIEGREVLAHRFNTRLFTFLGEQAVDGVIEDISAYNHAFVTMEETEEREEYGYYIFSSSDAYAQIRDFITEEKFPQLLNIEEVPQCDINAFNHHHARILDAITGAIQEPLDGRGVE